MNTIYDICIGLSVGIIAGTLFGGIKLLLNIRKSYSEERELKLRRLIDRFAVIIKYVTMVMLALGLVWCIYFLVLGAVVPEQTEYANNMSELIVAVLTVISIIFAFVEFLRRTDGGKDKSDKE